MVVRFRKSLTSLTLSTLVVASAVTAVAQTEAPTRTPGVATEVVEPGVERVIGDDDGHQLQELHPDHPRDIDHIAVAPDGTVWIASTARMSDNRYLDGYQVWPLGEPGLYGGDEGVPADISLLTFMPDGMLLAIGSEIARFDGTSWSRAEGSHRAATPDGTLWLLSPHDGLESWDGRVFVPHLPGRRLIALSVGDDGILRAFGHDGVAVYDGEAWTEVHASRDRLTTPDGATWQATGTGVERTKDGQLTRYLEGLNINGIALAPDGTLWVAAERDGRDRGGLYRIASMTAEAGTGTDASTSDPDEEPTPQPA